MSIKRLINRHPVWFISACLLLTGSLQASALEFSLYDSYGRKVTSQDYKGIPVFLEFGACW